MTDPRSCTTASAAFCTRGTSVHSSNVLSFELNVFFFSFPPVYPRKDTSSLRRLSSASLTAPLFPSSRFSPGTVFSHKLREPCFCDLLSPPVKKAIRNYSSLARGARTSIRWNFPPRGLDCQRLATQFTTPLFFRVRAVLPPFVLFERDRKRPLAFDGFCWVLRY